MITSVTMQIKLYLANICIKPLNVVKMTYIMNYTTKELLFKMNLMITAIEW